MSRQFFIMAQGKGSRWQPRSHSPKPWIPNVPKQLLPLGDETLITRTIRQLENEDITVIADGEFAPHVTPLGAKLHYFPNPGSLLRGIWLTKDQWKVDDIIILLGDVVFSNKAIKEILTVSASGLEGCVMFWREEPNPITGKTASERFAIYIPTEKREEFIGDIFYLFRFIESQGRDTKLWDYQKQHNPQMWKFEDYTDDMDSPEEYDQFWKLLSGAALEDDKKL